MNKKPLPPMEFDENPVWTEETTSRSKPAREVHGVELSAALVRRGRPTGSNKERIAIRIDRDILDRFKADGAGWQSRINEILRDWVSRH